MGVRKVWPRFYPTLDGGGDSDGEKVFQRVDESCQDCGVKVREGKSGLPRMCFVTISVLVILLSHPRSSMALTNKGGEIRVNVIVPKEADVGTSINLRCEWSLAKGDTLYSVKWYKDDHEFFRYVPDQQPRIQTFPLNGIYLDETDKTENSIRLKVTRGSSGQYKCEVSTEAPNFATTYRKANLTVIAPPGGNPVIVGLIGEYTIGENITANCTAYPSIPKAKMHWTINGETVTLENTVVLPPMEPTGPYHALPNTIGLRIQADTKQHDRGRSELKIVCIAKVGSKNYETTKSVTVYQLDNQRHSASDLRGGSCFIHGNILSVILSLFLAILST
ncbi:uncharacterized protein LOC117171484 [Belonocnema kinseyi]|uniref:uncharacterized protein LOC117171484 n=1 Tax=Belonocnema kinseyi TaxID=2817044 RepID=UPI00143D46F2|nr:uncharacterized protein LOC117171484 [Belonocnema kinseyi]